MTKKESPEYVQISTAAAMTLKFFPGRFNRGEKLKALNLLVTYNDGCRARCGYCGLSKSRDPEEKTFIRVDWPTVPLNDIIKRTKQHGKHLHRVCVSMITHPKAFEDMLTIMKTFKEETNLGISGLIAPTLIRTDEQINKIKEAGADKIGIAVDAVTPELFEQFRGNGVKGPHKWDHYWKTVERFVQTFGRGNVGVHLIVGLGETEKQMIQTIQKADDLGAKTHLFSFFPEEGSDMEQWSQPPYGQYRRIQLARHLINNNIQRIDTMKFNNKDQLIDFGTNIDNFQEFAEAFMTSGCAGFDGKVACNRPYGNERPSKPIRNYAFHPEPSDLDQIHQQIITYP